MAQFLKRIPLPITGIMLAFFALGNLYKESAPLLRTVLGICATIILVLVVLKALFAREAVAEELKNPVVVSVLPTLSMALLIATTYLAPFAGLAAAVLWVFALAFHVVLMAFYIKRVLMPFELKKIFATIFIPFVGIVCASVSAPAVGMITFGQAIFWFGLVAFIVCLPIALVRVFGKTPMPEPARPTSLIFAAPASLLIAGYLNAFDVKSVAMITVLGVVAVILLVLGLVLVFKTIKAPFAPSFSAFTFPLVISAIAMAGIGKFLAKQALVCPAFPALSIIALVLAWAGVLYATIRYCVHIFAPQK